MLTTDFTGTYDYEMEEAHHAAQYIIEDYADGYIESSDELHHAKPNRLDHCRTVRHCPCLFDLF